MVECKTSLSSQKAQSTPNTLGDLYRSRIRTAIEVPPPFSFFSQLTQRHYSYSRYQHEPQSPFLNAHVSRLSMDTSVTASASYPSPPPANMYGTSALRMYISPVSPSSLPTQGRSKSRSASRHKVTNYKSTFLLLLAFQNFEKARSTLCMSISLRMTTHLDTILITATAFMEIRRNR